MLPLSDEIKALFLADNTKEETRKTYELDFGDGFKISNTKILSESLTIKESLSEDEDIVFGSCEGAEMQISVADIKQDLTGKEFTLSVEISGNKIQLGVYTIESFKRQSNRRVRKIIAYDRMRWFNVDVADWYNGLTFPMTLKTFRDSLCAFIGIEQNSQTLILDTLQVTKTIEPETIQGLEVLKAICEINGCFGQIDRYGKLKYKYLQQTGLYPSETLYPDEELYPSEAGGDGNPTEVVPIYKQPMEYEEYLVQGIDGLTIRQEEGDIGASVGYGENPYIIEGNFLIYGKDASELSSIANTIYTAISGRTYRPAKIDCNGRPWLEVGDLVLAPTKDDVVETFVMKRTLSGCQALRDLIESTGNETRQEQFGITSKITQLEGKTAVIINTVDEVSVTLSNLKEETESRFELTDERIEAEVTRATEAEGQLSGRISVTEQEIDLKVSKGEVSSQISVESGGVNITGNRLTWTATNSSMSADGTLTAVNGNFSGVVTASIVSKIALHCEQTA